MSNRTRAKVTLETVTRHGTAASPSETWVFRPVCKKGGYEQGNGPTAGLDEDNTFAKFSPSGRFELTVNNPALVGTLNPGEQYYVDFTPVPVEQKS
jgi:hypothetical protein